MKTYIRPATQADLEQILKIEREAYSTEAYNYVVLRQFLDTSIFLVAEEYSEVRGFVIGSQKYASRTGWLLSLVVAPRYQQKNIGSLMLEAILEQMHQAGLEEVLLTVSPENEAALRLYNKWKFTDKGYGRDYFGKNKDRIVLYKIIKE